MQNVSISQIKENLFDCSLQYVCEHENTIGNDKLLYKINQYDPNYINNWLADKNFMCKKKS
jgi:hypothetical protein